jgi:hypothetical protein
MLLKQLENARWQENEDPSGRANAAHIGATTGSMN